MAFTAMQMQRSGLGGDVMKTDWRPLYDNAARHLSSALAKKRKEDEQDGVKVPLKFVLASLFLLTYTDVSSVTIPSHMWEWTQPMYFLNSTAQALPICTDSFPAPHRDTSQSPC
jgi:hypothetical protein